MFDDLYDIGMLCVELLDLGDGGLYMYVTEDLKCRSPCYGACSPQKNYTKQPGLQVTKCTYTRAPLVQ